MCGQFARIHARPPLLKRWEPLPIYSTWTVSSLETTHYVENVTTSSSTIANLCSIIEVTQLASDFLAAQETIARQLLRDYRPTDGMWPTEWIPGKIDAARAKFAEYLEHEVGNL